MRRLGETLGDERGAVAVAGLLLTFALTLLLATGLDIGRAFVLRAQLTAIADDAALAGAQRLDLAAWRAGRLALDPQAARSAALDELDANAATGAVVTSPGDVEVELDRGLSTVGLRFVGIARLEVTATAEAAPETP